MGVWAALERFLALVGAARIRFGYASRVPAGHLGASWRPLELSLAESCGQHGSKLAPKMEPKSLTKIIQNSCLHTKHAFWCFESRNISKSDPKLSRKEDPKSTKKHWKFNFGPSRAPPCTSVTHLIVKGYQNGAQGPQNGAKMVPRRTWNGDEVNRRTAKGPAAGAKPSDIKDWGPKI